MKEKEREKERRGKEGQSYKQSKSLSMQKRNCRTNKIQERAVFSEARLFRGKDKHQTEQRFMRRRTDHEKRRIQHDIGKSLGKEGEKETERGS